MAGPVCDCGAPPPKPGFRHERSCPVYVEWVGREREWVPPGPMPWTAEQVAAADANWQRVAEGVAAARRAEREGVEAEVRAELEEGRFDE